MSGPGKINSAHIEAVKCVYMAGPFLGKTPWHTYQNSLKAEAISAHLWDDAAQKVAVFTPHTNSGNMVGVSPERTYLVAGLRQVDRSDILFAMEGWRNSKGSKGEILRAVEMGVDVFFRYEELLQYLKQGDMPDHQKWNRCMCCQRQLATFEWGWGTSFTMCDECLLEASHEARYVPDFIRVIRSRRDDS